MFICDGQADILHTHSLSSATLAKHVNFAAFCKRFAISSFTSSFHFKVAATLEGILQTLQEAKCVIVVSGVPSNMVSYEYTSQIRL